MAHPAKLYLSRREQNLLALSEDFSQGPWTLYGTQIASDDQIQFIDGRISQKIVGIQVNTTHYLNMTTSVDVTQWSIHRVWLFGGGNNNVSVEMWERPFVAGMAYQRLWLNTNSASIYTSILSTGSADRFWYINELSSGWVEITHGMRVDATTGTGVHARVQLLSDSWTGTYSGDLINGVYIGRQQLVSGPIIGPYKYTDTATWAPDAQEFVEIFPEPEYRYSAVPIDLGVKTASGKTARLRYDTRRAISVPLRYVSSADAAIINSWWSTGAKLMFQDDDFESYSVMIINEKTPLAEITKPYIDCYSGVIELETY